MGQDGTGITKGVSRENNKAIRHLYRYGINQEVGLSINDKENLSLLGPILGVRFPFLDAFFNRQNQTENELSTEKSTYAQDYPQV